MSENRKCTIVDVARAAGTSTATVSRILSGSDYPISAQLRKKVMQVAQDLNYKPNLIGKMLQSGVGDRRGSAIHCQPLLREPDVCGGGRMRSAFLCADSVSFAEQQPAGVAAH